MAIRSWTSWRHAGKRARQDRARLRDSLTVVREESASNKLLRDKYEGNVVMLNVLQASSVASPVGETPTCNPECDRKVVYWHRELPPLDAEPMGEHTVEANSMRV